MTRRYTGEVLFNSTPPIEREDDCASFSGLVFENQFLEFSTQLAQPEDGNEPILYGLGERVGPARLHADEGGDLYPMFARAPNVTAPVHTRSGGDNLYGVHPFVLQLEDSHSGSAHGVFVLSSNAMEVVARREALTYRITGGILDIFVFAGPTPQDVIAQYTDIVGRPAMPPYWALGYHVGRRGGDESSVDDAVKVVTQLRMAGVPMDAYWQDIDYMADNGRTLSLDERSFPTVICVRSSTTCTSTANTSYVSKSQPSRPRIRPVVNTVRTWRGIVWQPTWIIPEMAQKVTATVVITLVEKVLKTMTAAR